MNNRIKELAKQAGADFMRRINYNNLEGEEYEEDAGVIFDSKESFEKFAELIIKETLEVARAGVEFGDGMESAVENYFGVKL